MSPKPRFRPTMSRLFILAALLSGMLTTHPAWALGGLPGTPQFGYGARLDIQGQGIRQAIDLAAGMNFTWLLVEFDWSFYWPDPTKVPNLDQLDAVAALAKAKNLCLVISLFNPPSWVLSDQGPSPERTAQLASLLASRYPGLVLAFELFPGANTVSGWSASPSPKRFAHLLQHVSTELNITVPGVHLIATLSPLLPESDAKNIPDGEFLIELYQNDWQSGSYILGIRYPQITGDTLSPPTASGIPVLRHYEEIRNIIIEHQDEHRLIWVTGFSWPGELAYRDNPASEQASWLFQAYRLLTAQLYIGAAFFEQLNPNDIEGIPSLLQPDASLHPACSMLSQLANPTNVVIPGLNNKGSLHSYIMKDFTK